MATVVFAANNESYRKRKRVHRACEQCKKQRRRCEPALNGTGRCASCAKDGILCSLSEPTPPSPPDPDPVTPDAAESRTRFVGDLNPEAVFLTSSRPTTEIQRDLTECGVWDQKSPTPGAAAAPRQYRSRMSPAYQMYLENIRAFDLPDKRVLDGLVELYFQDIHPLLPMLDVEKFKEDRKKDTVSLPLLLAICLVAIKHPDAEHLVPRGKTKRSWAARVADQIIALVNGGIEPDRLTLTRVHLLLALHSEGPAGNENASLHLSTALHHAYSLGIQMNRVSIQQTPSDLFLWWCLWVMDAIQAVICGRPLGIRRADVSVPFPTELDIDIPPEFRTLLGITDVLIRVIALYRPCAGRAEWVGEWPVFTDADFGEGGRGDVLRLYYLAVSMLSARSLPMGAASARQLGIAPSPAAQHRRVESAKAVLEICRARSRWLPLPIVPYSVALSLSVFYSILPTSPNSYDSFLATCSILESLSPTWWFAGAIAKIGRQAFEKIKVAEAAGTLREMQGAGDNHTHPVPSTGVDVERVSAVGAGSEGIAMMQDEVRDGTVTWDTGLSGDNGLELGGDEWFLQLFPEVVVPVDFWRGLDIDVEDGVAEMGMVGTTGEVGLEMGM